MWDFESIPNNLSLEQSFIEPPLKLRFFLIYNVLGHMPYVKHHLPRAHRSPYYFVQHPPTQLSLNPVLILFVGKTSWTLRYSYWYDIINFGPKPSWFCFWASPQKYFIPIECCPCLYTRKPSLVYLMWDFECIPNNLYLKQSFTKSPFKPRFFLIFIVFGYTPYVKHYLPRIHHSPHHFVRHP